VGIYIIPLIVKKSNRFFEFFNVFLCNSQIVDFGNMSYTAYGIPLFHLIHCINYIKRGNFKRASLLYRRSPVNLFYYILFGKIR